MNDEFKELAQLLDRNNRWHNPKKMAEEEGRLAREPIGDWQSPSDNARWDNLRYDLETARLKYNIESSQNKEEELEMLQRKKWVIEEMLDQYKRSYLCAKVEKKKTTAQKIYALFFRVKESPEKAPINDSNRLRVLLQDINRQIPFYLNP